MSNIFYNINCRSSIPESSQKPSTSKTLGRPRGHPIKALTQSKKDLNLSEEDSDDSTEITGKKTKINNFSSLKKVKSQESFNNSSNVRQNHVENNNIQQTLSNPSHRNWSFEPHKYDQNVKENAVASLAENHQQQSNSILGVSDRISKEKQKFFRFSVFNIERKSKFEMKNTKKLLKQRNDDNATNEQANLSSKSSGQDKYAFTSNSDSSCDTNKIKHNKFKNNSSNNSNNNSRQPLKISTSKKLNNNNNSSNLKGLETPHISSDEESQSSCCSSDNESSSASSTSSDSSSDSDDSSLNRESNPTPFNIGSSNQSFKTDTISTMNVFACINSRELLNSSKKSNCWSSLPFVENQKLDTLHKLQNASSSRSFGFSSSSTTIGNDIWGFAAEAKKTTNVFNTGSETKSSEDTYSDHRINIVKPNSSSSNIHPQNLSAALRKRLLRNPNEYFVKSRRTTTLMNNNFIASSDEEANPLSPSKLFKKAVTYKKFDIFSNKCLLMGANHGQNDAKNLNTSYEMDNSNQSTIKCSQSPYKDNNQFDLGKNSKESYNIPLKKNI